MVLNSLSQLNSATGVAATECIERIRSGTSSSEFGLKIQAVAAHVLLRLNYRITTVNQPGHPDIAAIRDGTEYRFEVEAEFTKPTPRKLTEADFASLTGVPGVVGYYARAILLPSPRWILVPAVKLVDRRLPASDVLLEALSDRGHSNEWTVEYQRLLQSACRQIRLASFKRLSEMAIEGRSL